MSSNPYIIGPKIGVIDEQNDGSTYGDNMRQVLRMLQALLQPNIINMTTSVPPAAPTNGDTYVVASGPSGLWAGQANNIAYWTLDSPLSPGGVWEFYAPLAGWLVVNRADGSIYTYSGTAWVKLSTGGGGGVSGKWPGNWIGSNAAGYFGGAFGQGGNIGMDLAGYGAVAFNVQNPTATTPKGIQSPGGFSSSVGIIDQQLNITLGILTDWFARVSLIGLSASRYWLGICDATTSSAQTVFFSNTPAANFVGFRYVVGTDADIMAVCQTDATHQTLVDTGVTAGPLDTFEIVPTASGTVITFYINGTLVATINTNVPSASTPLASIFAADSMSNGASNSQFNFFYAYALLIS